MGCACPTDHKGSREVTGDEEITVFETALAFSKLPAAKVASEVLVFSHGYWMNGKQIRDLFRALGMDPLCLNEEHSPKFHLFELFRDRKRYNARKLTMLGVLLGTGSAIKKAEILFSIYKVDEDQSDLSASQVFQLVQDACEVGLLALPQYARLELEVLGDTNALPKLTKFSEKLGANLPTTVQLLTTTILADTEAVSEVMFKAKIANSDAKVLCCASELRAFAARSESTRRSRAGERLSSEGPEEKQSRPSKRSSTVKLTGTRGDISGSTEKSSKSSDAGRKTDPQRR